MWDECSDIRIVVKYICINIIISQNICWFFPGQIYLDIHLWSVYPQIYLYIHSWSIYPDKYIYIFICQLSMVTNIFGLLLVYMNGPQLFILIQTSFKIIINGKKIVKIVQIVQNSEGLIIRYSNLFIYSIMIHLSWQINLDIHLPIIHGNKYIQICLVP